MHTLWRRFHELGARLFPLVERSPVPSSPHRWLPLAALAGILLLVLALYWPIRNNPLETESYVSQQLSATTPPLRFFATSAFLEEKAGKYYRPFTRAVDGLAIRATGGEPNGAVAHRVSIALHLACVALLFGFARTLFGGVAAPAFAALWFGLHPSLTAAVVYISVRWNLYSGALFLCAAWLAWWALRRSEGFPRWGGVALAATLLPMALTAEPGAIAMGAFGLWFAIETWRRAERRVFLFGLLPLALAPLAYVAMRWNALGGFGMEYAAAAELPLRRAVRIHLEAFAHDAAVLLQPLRLGPLDRYDGARRVLLAACALWALPFAAPLAFRASRRALLALPLPLVGIAVFFAVQAKTVWRLPHPSIAVHGIDRSYLFYFPALLVALLLGRAAAAALSAKDRHLRFAAITAGVALLAASAWQLHRGVALWRAAGDQLLDHERQLAERLRAHPLTVPIHLRRFPDRLAAPYLPWAQTYYLTHPIILSYWGGHRLPARQFTVLADNRDGPLPPDFEGALLTLREDGTIEWRDHSAAAMEAAHAARIARAGPAAPNPLTVAETFGAELETTNGDTLRARLLHADPQFILRPAQPLGDHRRYGTLAFDLRVTEVLDRTTSPTVQLYFRGDGAPFSETASIKARIAADGAWHRIALPLARSLSWQETQRIEALRLDPMDRAGVVELRPPQLLAPVE